MARPRTPTSVLEIRGAFKANPQRAQDRANEPVVTEPLGEPPKTFTGDQIQAWTDIVNYAPKGVLTSADTLAVERAARLLAKIRMGSASETEGRSFDALLGKFGMTPSDRSKVSVAVPTQRPGNPFSHIN
jgi:hypothetical protein